MLCVASPLASRRRAVGLIKGLGVDLTLWGVPRRRPSPDPLLSQQPSEDLVPYDTDLYQRQTHEYYPYLSSDGESHSGE